MRTHRRDFLRAGAVAAAGAAAACSSSTPPPQPAAAPTPTSPMSLMLQLSGLLIHGRWPAKDASKPFVYAGWDALLVHDMDHRPQLRMAVANVKGALPYDKSTNPHGYMPDRSNVGIGAWDLTNLDVVVKLDDVAQGEVTGVSGKRRIVNGKPSACPDPAKDDEYLDITWLADFVEILGKTGGLLKPELKGAPKNFSPNLVGARVRLPQGSIACARPTLEEFERETLGYKDSTYTPQFTADLTRFTSKAASKITLDLVSFTDGATKATLELVGGGGGPIVAYVENHDPLLGKKVLDGVIKKADYWDHHFKPYHGLLKAVPAATFRPVLNCCPDMPVNAEKPRGADCDPPLYCIPPGGSFEL